ncbi:MAG: hypothetical protein IPM35_11970 [Myxococcales bacterium]|nr:hypothetical protein [Myxococcales bacterium]
MSGRRVVLRGSIRVDARRARAKLREHLLVDLHGYSLELARAAIALGAGAMNVSWDADEVAFAFDGPALPGERLARLLDFALSDAEDERAAPLRSLALGVNAALGLGAEAVTVTSTDDAAACAVRFTPELFADESDKPLELQAKSCRPPRDAFARGTHVHVKKRLGLDVLKRAVSSSVPAEVALLIEHTAESPLALSCAGRPAPRKPEPPLLARVPFTLPLARRAAVELRAPGAPCRIDVMERGVRLLTLSWTPLPGLGATEGLAAPVRVVVDADELPTNASRSALREDSPLARELLPAAEAAFRKLLAGLVARAKREALPEGVEAPALTEQAWRASLGTLVCLATAALRARNQLDPEVRALFDLPLFDSPGGGRVSVGRVLSSRPVRVWRSKQDLPEDLAPWLSDVVWLRGHFVERLLDDMDVEDAAGLVKRAREGAARRQRFLAHAPGEPRVPPVAAELLRQSFSTASGTTQGLHGEVVLLAPLPAGATRPSLLRVFVEERMLEALPIEPSFCPLAFDAAIAWPSALRPRFDYDGVERDARLNQALHAVTLAAIGIADRAAERLETLPALERAALELVLRNAVAAYSVVPARLGQNTPLAKRFRRDFVRLYRAPIYPAVAGDRVSLASLAAYAEKTKALCVASGLRDAPARPAADGRPVVIVGGVEADAILALLDGKVERIPYDDAARRTDTPEGRRAALMRAVTDERVRQGLSPLSAKLWFEREGALVVVAPAVFAASIEHHRSVALSCTPRDDGLSSLIVAMDDPATVPNAAWNGIHYKPRRLPAWFEQRFVERLVDALEGDLKAQRALGLVSPLAGEDLALVLCLLGRAVNLRARVAGRAGKPERPTDAQQRQLLERIEKLPLLCSLDDAGAPCSLSIASIAARHGESVPLLDAAPGFPTGDWQPLLVRSERERDLLTRLFPRAVSGAPELGQRRERALSELQKQQLLASPAREIRDLDTRLASGDLVQHVQPRPAAELLGELEVVLALPPAGLSPGVGWVSLSFAGRPIHLLAPSQVGLPIVANVSSTRASDFVAFSAPSEAGLGRVGSMLREASFDLLQALARQGLLLSDGRALALCLALHDLGAGELVRLLFQGPHLRFPTVQGGSAALGELATNGLRLLFGSERYPEWLASAERQSELDQPVLFLPPGDLGAQLAALLGRHGHGARRREPSARRAPAPAWRWSRGCTEARRCAGPPGAARVARGARRDVRRWRARAHARPEEQRQRALARRPQRELRSGLGVSAPGGGAGRCHRARGGAGTSDAGARGRGPAAAEASGSRAPRAAALRASRHATRALPTRGAPRRERARRRARVRGHRRLLAQPGRAGGGGALALHHPRATVSTGEARDAAAHGARGRVPARRSRAGEGGLADRASAGGRAPAHGPAAVVRDAHRRATRRLLRHRAGADRPRERRGRCALSRPDRRARRHALRGAPSALQARRRRGLAARDGAERRLRRAGSLLRGAGGSRRAAAPGSARAQRRAAGAGAYLRPERRARGPLAR